MLRKSIIRLNRSNNFIVRTNLSSDRTKIEEEIEKSKNNLTWRRPYAEREGEWSSKFKLFGSKENQNSDLIAFLQQPIDLSPAALKKWWAKREIDTEKHMQQYIKQRHEILGSELAAAHFVVHRGGSVKFTNNSKWVKADENGNYELPNSYVPTYMVEAIRCDHMVLYYEGLANIRRLKNLKFLSFHNVQTFDDWCLDRVSGSEHENLEVLDISGTRTTTNGLSCLYRFKSLKVLVVDDSKKSKEYELCCAMLEDCLPKLKICNAKDIHSE